MSYESLSNLSTSSIGRLSNVVLLSNLGPSDNRKQLRFLYTYDMYNSLYLTKGEDAISQRNNTLASIVEGNSRLPSVSVPMITPDDTPMVFHTTDTSMDKSDTTVTNAVHTSYIHTTHAYTP